MNCIYCDQKITKNEFSHCYECFNHDKEITYEVVTKSDIILKIISIHIGKYTEENSILIDFVKNLTDVHFILENKFYFYPGIFEINLDEFNKNCQQIKDFHIKTRCLV